MDLETGNAIDGQIRTRAKGAASSEKNLPVLSVEAVEERVSEKLQELEESRQHSLRVNLWSALGSIACAVVGSWLGGVFWGLWIGWWILGARALAAYERLRQIGRQQQLIRDGALGSHKLAREILAANRFALLARSFYTEAIHATSHVGHYTVIHDHWHSHPTGQLLEAIAERLPVLTLANAENVHSGRAVSSLWCEEDWQETFAYCLQKAELVIVFFTDETEGLGWELELIERYGAWCKTLLVSWEKPADEAPVQALRAKSKWFIRIPRVSFSWGSVSQPDTDMDQLEELLSTLERRSLLNES